MPPSLLLAFPLHPKGGMLHILLVRISSVLLSVLCASFTKAGMILDPLGDACKDPYLRGGTDNNTIWLRPLVPLHATISSPSTWMSLARSSAAIAVGLRSQRAILLSESCALSASSCCVSPSANRRVLMALPKTDPNGLFLFGGIVRSL